MRSLPFRPESLSGVVAFYSIHHLPRGELGEVLDEFHRVLIPAGLLVVATHLGAGEVYTDEFLGHRIEVVGGTLFQEGELRAALQRRSFEVIETGHREALPDEYQSKRVYLTARRVDA